MPRPSKWQSKTTAIRVPEHAAEQLLAIAKQLDSQSFVQNPAVEPLLFTIEASKGVERYLIQAEPCTEDEMAQVEAALAKLYAKLGGGKLDDLLYVAAKIAQQVGTPLP